MALLVSSLLLFLIVKSYSYVIIDDDDPTSSIEWPTEYYFKAESIDLLTSIVHPIEMWYNAEHNRSRVDLYDGEIKKYYLAPTDDDSGSYYLIHSVTSKELENVMLCMKLSTDDEDVQEDLLPDVTDMEFVRSEKYNGKDVQIWRRETISYDDTREVETLTVYRTEHNVDIPYEFTQTTYNIKKGNEKTNKLIKYYEYKSTVDLKDLEISEDEFCLDFGKTGKNFKNDLKVLHPMLSGDVDRAFKSYKKHHNKKYGEDEHEYRKRIFHENWKYIEEHNRKNLGFKLEVNKFADRTEEELQYLSGTFPSKSVGTVPFHTPEEIEAMMDEIPEEYDLRIEGAMRPVKDQDACGSCWAFCTTATVEGALAKNLGDRTVDLSEQSLVDCAWGYDNMGCSGGMLDTAFKYIMDHGIPEDVDYGLYKAADAVCHIQNHTTTSYKIRGFGLVNPYSANSLKVAVYKYGPVAVAIQAKMSMKLYSSGVYYDPTCGGTRINHGVTVVGYGTQDNVPYWIVRNSWGEDWGEDGYILMSAVENNCLILDTPYYVVV